MLGAKEPIVPITAQASVAVANVLSTASSSFAALGATVSSTYTASPPSGNLLSNRACSPEILVSLPKYVTILNGVASGSTLKLTIPPPVQYVCLTLKYSFISSIYLVTF